MNIALLGASGAIGRSCAAALHAAGTPYRAIGRSQSALSSHFGSDPLAQVVVWNPDDPASALAALRGVGTLLYLVGVNYWQFELHPPLMRKTLDAALAAGVQRIVLIGTVYPYGRPLTNPVREDHPRRPHTFKGRMRKEQEDVLLAAHEAGHIEATILRLPDFYGPDVQSSLLHRLFTAAASGGTADLIGPLERPHEFVFTPDVGPVVLRLAAEPAAYGRAWHLAGAGVTTQQAIVDEVSRQIGRPQRVRAAGKTVLRMMGLFNPFMRELVEMHYLMTDPVLMDDSALQALIGPIGKTPYEEGIRQCLAAARVAPTHRLTRETQIRDR